MLLVDDFTIIVGAVLIIFLLLALFADVFFRKLPQQEESSVELKPISVVIIADNNSVELENNLPLFLSQDYPAGYEVIVVVSKDEDGTDDVLKAYSAHVNLHVTFVPNSSRYMSNRKLAITLGVKAAKNEWILLTDADCYPATNEWISTMASHIHTDTNLIMGYNQYTLDKKAFYRFEFFRRVYVSLLEAADTAYSCVARNIMFKKNSFMAGYGFRGSLKYLRGEYDFLVNKYASQGTTSIVTDESATLIEKSPSHKMLINRLMYYLSVRKILQRSRKHVLCASLDMLTLYLSLCANLVVFVYSLLQVNLLLLGISILCLILLIFLRTFNALKAIKKLDMELPAWKLFLFEIRLLWHNMYGLLKYWKADKIDFISHKS